MLRISNVAKQSPYLAKRLKQHKLYRRERERARENAASNVHCPRSLQRQRHPPPARSDDTREARSSERTHTRRLKPKPKSEPTTTKRNETKRNESLLLLLALAFATQSALSPCRCLLANGCVVAQSRAACVTPHQKCERVKERERERRE